MKTAVEIVFVGKDRLYNRRFLQVCKPLPDRAGSMETVHKYDTRMFIQLHSPLRYRRDRERKLALQKPRLIFQSRGYQAAAPFKKTHQRPSYGLVSSTRSQKPGASRPQAARSLRRQAMDTRPSRSRPGLWTARAMRGPTRPQPLPLCQPSTSIDPPTSYGGPAGNILR